MQSHPRVVHQLQRLGEWWFLNYYLELAAKPGRIAKAAESDWVGPWLKLYVGVGIKNSVSQYQKPEHTSQFDRVLIIFGLILRFALLLLRDDRLFELMGYQEIY